MDGQLFLIKQLLILREQIAPFEADFAVTEKDLDFSHMRDHMRRILAGQSKLFSFGTDNAVVQLVSRGGPRVLESQVRLLRCILRRCAFLHLAKWGCAALQAMQPQFRFRSCPEAHQGHKPLIELGVLS